MPFYFVYAKIMTMIESYWYEFSKIYARLMRIEIQIKKRAIYAVKAIYGQNAYAVFKKFFNNKRRRKRYTDAKCNCKFDTIINSNILTGFQKFENLVNMLYLSDTLNLILKTQEFKTPNIDSLFYHKQPNRYKDLEDCIQDLNNLRNCIAHYNFKLYSTNKKQYLDSLLLFEIHIGHNIAGINSLPQIQKLSVSSILQEIYKLKPDLILDIKKSSDPLYFDKHRVLLTLFDDIALYNGLPANKLPSPWSILRAMYKFKSKLEYQHKLANKN